MPHYWRSRRTSSPKKRKKKKRSIPFTSFMKPFAVAFLILLVGGLYSLKRLDRLIDARFDQPRKWNLPSRVFSDAEYLYPGVDIRVRSILEKLDRLNYRKVADEIKTPGDYAFTPSRLDIYLHDFAYPTENFEGFPVHLSLSRSRIAKIQQMQTGEELELVRLEPEMVASIFDERMEDRTLIELKNIPPALLEAIIIMEDTRFFQHHGIDPIGIARAAVVNFKAGRIVQGGSTLTQQLVKNFFLTPKRSFVRKINEAFMALLLERNHTKAEILQAYLNEIYFGQRGASSISGVAEAAKYYFAKQVNQLSIAECALLAGMIRSPNEYNPARNTERAKQRRDTVLAKMHETALITDEEYAGAREEVIISPKRNIRLVTAPYFLDFVKQQLMEFYPQEVLESEGIRIFTTLDMRAQLAAEHAVDEGLTRLETSYRSLLPKGHKESLQSCFISMTPSNGYIRAMVGGRDYRKSQFNRCAQSLRQPGSTFKPFVYLTAFDPKRSDKRFTPSTLIDDMSFSMESGGEEWSPRNYDEEEHGTVTLRTALEKSYNIATAKLAIDVGLDRVVKTAQDAGITNHLSPVPSLALGAFEVRPLELSAAYTLFPNGGIRAEPIAIMQVVTKEGEVLEQKRIKMQRKFDAAPVAITTHILKGVIDRGTGAAARAWGYRGVAAGKTGTSSNYRDAWFVGFTPDLLALSWVGFDDNAEMGLSGARAALPIWTQFMKQVAPENSHDFPRPQNVVLVKVDSRTGGLPARGCSDTIYEAFLKGMEPEEKCDSVYLKHEPVSRELF